MSLLTTPFLSASQRAKQNVKLLATRAPPVLVEIWGSPSAPTWPALRAKCFLPILKDLGEEVVDLRLGWIARENPSYPTGFWSLHGQTEILGNTWVSCVQARKGATTALQFADCMNVNLSATPSYAASCARSLSLPVEEIRACAFGAEGRQYVRETAKDADARRVVWSPTIFIDGERYCLWHSSPCKANTPHDFLAAICHAYKGPKPSRCPTQKT